jgi:hypothetical protein|tara:strand:- start:185 stop:310 length:126 start_codon:yes stop_codon:yes gene_type:complete
MRFTEEELHTLGWSIAAACALMFLIMAPNICFHTSEDPKEE